MANSVQPFLGGVIFAPNHPSVLSDDDAAKAFVVAFDAAEGKAVPAALFSAATPPRDMPGDHPASADDGLADASDTSSAQQPGVPLDLVAFAFSSAATQSPLPQITADLQRVSLQPDPVETDAATVPSVVAAPAPGGTVEQGQNAKDEPTLPGVADAPAADQAGVLPALFGAAGIRPAGAVDGTQTHPSESRSAPFQGHQPLALSTLSAPSLVDAAGVVVAAHTSPPETRRSDPDADLAATQVIGQPAVSGAQAQVQKAIVAGSVVPQQPSVYASDPSFAHLHRQDVLPIPQEGFKPNGSVRLGMLPEAGKSAALPQSSNAIALHVSGAPLDDPGPASSVVTPATAASGAPMPATAASGAPMPASGAPTPAKAESRAPTAAVVASVWQTRAVAAVQGPILAKVPTGGHAVIAPPSDGAALTPLRTDPDRLGRLSASVPQQAPKPVQTQLETVSLPQVVTEGGAPPDPETPLSRLSGARSEAMLAQPSGVEPDRQRQPALPVANDITAANTDKGVAVPSDQEQLLPAFVGLPKADVIFAQNFFPHAIPAAGSPPVPVAALPQALVAAARADNAQTVNLQLDPIELGSVAFNMETGPAGLVVTITAERPETLELLRRHADQFLADLRQSGFQGASLQFGHSGQEPSGQGPSGQGQWGQGQNSQPQPHGQLPTQHGALAPLPETPPRTSRSMQMGGLNLRL